MNVYDFDQTIFYPDSSYCFCRYCFKKYPKLFAPLLPGAAAKLMGKLAGVTSTKSLKEQTFSFLKRLPDVDAEVDAFWREHWRNVLPWYLTKCREDDVIISASPEFLLLPAAQQLGVRLIATPMDTYSGRINGNNCHDEEKVRRFYAEYPGAQIDEFYSDSLSDTPLAKLAKTAFIVKRGAVCPWPEN